jgi:hypothetical protein
MHVRRAVLVHDLREVSSVTAKNDPDPATDGSAELVGSVDPYDLDALRIDGTDDVAVEKLLITIPVRRPSKQQYFRVNPDPAYTIDTAVFVREDGIDKETYLVAPGMRDYLVGDYHRVRLFTCVTKRRTPFLWSVRLPDDESGGAGQSWHRSALEAADEGRKFWIRLQANRESGSYDVYRARGDLGDPVWPDKPFRELIQIAFKNHFIDTPYHDIIRELNGEL